MKTRLIIKNIPNKVTEDSLKNFFIQNLDCKVSELKLHSNRGFAFVGFLNETDTAKALKLDGTRFKNAPLKIEECLEIKEQSTKKKGKENANANISSNNNTELDNSKKDSENSSKIKAGKVESTCFDSFLQSKVDPTLDEEDDADESKNVPKKTGKHKKKKGLKREVPKTLYAVAIKGMLPSTKSKEIKEFLNPIPCDFIQLKKNGSAVVLFASDKHRQEALKRNRGFIGKKRVSVRPHNAANTQPHEEQNSTAAQSKVTKREFIPSKTKEEVIEELQDTGRLFLRNLAFDCQEEDLINIFSPYGKLTEINVAYDNRLQQNKGFGFVSFMFPEHAIKAYQDLDRSIFMGRNLHILPAQPRPEQQEAEDEEDDEPTAQFKNKKEKQLKSSSSSSYNWNTLFISPEAVATVVAQQQGVSKEDFVSSKDKTGAAVRLALGETQLVLETKQFLESQGIHLEAFENTNSTFLRKIRAKTGEINQAHLSLTTFLAKNLPVGIAQEEITELFSKFTGFKRCIVPPYGLTAIVEYRVPQQAKAAFKSLAYSKLKDKMLLLEWAPVNLITEEKSAPDNETAPQDECEIKQSDKKRNRKRKLSANEEEEKESSAPPAGEEDQSPQFKQPTLDNSSETANKNLKVKKSDDDSIPMKKEQPKSNVIIVKNIAFQAAKKEIESLFSPFGKIIAIRLPQKPNGDHRGFAFIEFSCVEEAEKSMEAFGLSTHFYGRRLVIEYSAKEQSR